MCTLSNLLPTGINVFFTDTRSQLQITDNILSITTTDNTKAVGEIREGDQIKSIGSNPDSAYSLADATSAEIWVVGQNDEIIDYLSTSTYPHRHSINPGHSLKRQVLNGLASGEGLMCEFKVYISLVIHSKKSFEIDESVCALSNTQGGIVVIGVTDHLEVVGVENNVVKDYKSNPGESIRHYIQALSKRLSENIINSDCISIASLDLFSHTLIVIQVDKAPKYNYLRSDGLPRFRRGPHNIDGTREVFEDLQRNVK